MALELQRSGNDRVVDVRVSGKLSRQDYEKFVPAVEEEIREHGKLRIVFDMHDFHGWEFDALWEDTKFDVQHFSDIERLAMIGDKKWESWMAKFCRPFTTANIRYFDQAEADRARQWVREE